MFSIGVFARLGEVSIRTLRHYDEIGLLRPAQVDPDTGYRGYSADQLRQLNRIVALKELGLSLSQVRQLTDGITVGELRGMLLLRRAQLELDIESQTNLLRGVEARLRYIEREGVMPADDIKARTIPATPVVAIAEPAEIFGPEAVVPAVNRAAAKFDELRIRDLIQAAGPFMFFYETGAEESDGVTVYVAIPVSAEPDALPAPAKYLVLPEIEAAVTVRNGIASTIFPAVYHDLARWVEEHDYRPTFPGREIWVHEVDEVSQADQQVFEIQLPFTRVG